MDRRYIIRPMMERATTPKYFNDQILTGQRKGYSDFVVDVSNCTRTYPNICVPISAIVDYYTQKRKMNFTFQHSSDKTDYICHTSFHSPKIVEETIGGIALNTPFDKVWRFGSSEGVNALVTAFVAAVREGDQVEPGIISGIEWCLNETMDNVLQHSTAPYGFIMGQLQRQSKKLLISIYDWGIGIYNSLKHSKFRPLTPIDAITLALQERVTRDERVGQGNGMWGLSQIIKENHGIIRINSSGASYFFHNDIVETIERGYLNFGDEYGSTFVDFQLDYSSPIDVGKALGGYEPTDLWLENKELDSGEYAISIAEIAHGTGTRQSASRVRNIVLNIIREKRKRIILDFDRVNMVSSSFADELLGKIIGEYGFMFFVNTFVLKNISLVNAKIINRSIEQRMAQKYYDPSLKDFDD